MFFFVIGVYLMLLYNFYSELFYLLKTSQNQSQSVGSIPHQIISKVKLKIIYIFFYNPTTNVSKYVSTLCFFEFILWKTYSDPPIQQIKFIWDFKIIPYTIKKSH